MAVEQVEVDPAKVDEFMGRLMQDFAGAGAVPLTLIGIRTGLWAALAGAGPLTPAEVAERSGTAERYVAEWLKAHPALGRHLRETISTGTSCVYAPATPVDWEL